MKQSKPKAPLADMVAKDVTINGDGWQLGARVSVSTSVTEPAEMLPLARALSDAVVAETSKISARQGEPVTCGPKCGACCRHLVAISEIEAHRIADVVRTLPEPRQTAVRARFAAAREGLGKAGMLEILQNTDAVTDEQYGPLALSYFNQSIACPFLEDESCSIYDERPITCREYLVTSPKECCSRPEENSVRRLQMPLKVFNAVAKWSTSPGTNFEERWVPLILAPEWSETNSSVPSTKTGVQLLKELLHHLSVRDDASAE